MRIGINLRYLQKSTSGIERATLELLQAMGRLPGDHSFIGYITDRPFASDQTLRDLLSCPRLELRQTRLWHEDVLFRFLWDLFGVGQQAKRDCVDVFWGPSFSLPFFLHCPGVVTIYDTSNLYFPNSFDWVTRLFHWMVMPLSARRAQAILTISESSKDDIILWLGVTSQRVHVIPLACDRQFRPLPSDRKELTQVLQHYGIQQPFWLTVAQISPRKNLAHLVRVYARLKRERHISQQLVLAGRNGWLHQEVHTVVQQEGVQSDVIFTGGVPDSDLVALYNTAEIFVYPSLYEGFGLPVLEAMACGTPVIASNTSSLPEVVGDAGILLPPTDVQAWADALWGLIRDPARHAELREHGLARAAQFSWERGAQAMLNNFRQVTVASQ